VAGRSWAASGRTRAPGRGARPAGSWPVAVQRARDAWDALTGGPNVDVGPDTSSLAPGEIVDGSPDGPLPRDLRYSDMAAASILDTALRLWPDTAATMGGDPEGDSGVP
jgi:hypothetical protein